MLTLVQAVLASSERTDLRQFIGELQEKKYLLRNDIITAFSDYCHKYEKPTSFQATSHLGQLIAKT